MHRARRIASVALAASLAATGLAGCRSAPSVAAYVGENRISEDRVSAVFDDARDNAVAPTADQPATPVIKRQDVVDTLVGLDVMRAIARQRGISPTALDAAKVAQSVGLKADAEYVRLYGEYRGLFDAVTSRAKPVQPTAADLRDVYNRLTEGGTAAGAPPFEQFSSSISDADRQTLADNLGVRNDLQPQIAKLNTVVNPRYSAPELPLVSARGPDGQELPLVVLSFAPSRGTSPVIDVS